MKLPSPALPSCRPAFSRDRRAPPARAWSLRTRLVTGPRAALTRLLGPGPVRPPDARRARRRPCRILPAGALVVTQGGDRLYSGLKRVRPVGEPQAVWISPRRSPQASSSSGRGGLAFSPAAALKRLAFSPFSYNLETICGLIAVPRRPR